MNLVQALEKQIEFCEQYTKYKCGVFVRTKEQYEIVMKCISNLLLNRSNTQLKNYGCYWNNGNCIEVLPLGRIFMNGILMLQRIIINIMVKTSKDL